MIAADVQVCIDYTSQHSATLTTTAFSDPDAVLTLNPGDCYQTSNGERVTLTMTSEWRRDTNVQDNEPDYGRTHDAGTYLIKAYKSSRTIWVKVY